MTLVHSVFLCSIYVLIICTKKKFNYKNIENLPNGCKKIDKPISAL